MFVEQVSQLNVLRLFLIVIIANSRSHSFAWLETPRLIIRKSLFLAIHYPTRKRRFRKNLCISQIKIQNNPSFSREELCIASYVGREGAVARLIRS